MEPATNVTTVREQRLLNQIAATSDPKELDKLKLQLKKMRMKPRRVIKLVPPRGPKSKLLPMDRPTELALEFLLSPKCPVRCEATEHMRQAIQFYAEELGWEPPEEVE
ncbi:MAG: hypothetical protein FOGNACKC_00735 [Anaerolineae bacterium]|nr:hypothetical protein [Anaerolineae bacterium]